MGKHERSKKWKRSKLGITNIFNNVFFFEAEVNGATRPLE
jgi:hypothetical protein